LKKDKSNTKSWYWNDFMSTAKTKISRKSPLSEVETYSPKTSRGRRLLALRQKIIAAGIPLLGPEEIEEEVRERRGEDE
jgi:hypothetical protein